MCGIIGSISVLAVGGILVVVSCVISFAVLPNFIENAIISETVLEDGTDAMERFENIPFPVNFTVRVFNLSNSAEYMNGAVPVLEEIGPYVYKLYQSREILEKKDDIIRYRRWERFEFDAEASFPYTEDDMLTVVNVPYHAIIQIAESMYPSLASVLNLAMNGVFGEHNSPVTTYRIQDLLFNGVPLCKNAGVIANLACAIIRQIGASAQNLDELEDGSLVFSVLGYKHERPSGEYEVFRGLNDHTNLGEIITYNKLLNFTYWTNDLVTEEEGGEEVERLSVCNMINGTDAGIFAPLIDTSNHLYAVNTDICRSVELRYELDTEYEGIPAVRYAANEWLLDNDDGCFCLNVTTGVNRGDGCLLKGAMELYSCVGAFLVMSYPHFLYADEAYRNGVIGMSPDEESHKIFLDIEPNTGTPVRGFKRAQFNIFTRPVTGIGATSNLNPVLVPFLWVEEGINLPEEYVEELTTQLLNRLRLVDILVPVLIAICCLVMVVGIALTVRVKCKKSPPQPNEPSNGSEVNKPK